MADTRLATIITIAAVLLLAEPGCKYERFSPSSANKGLVERPNIHSALAQPQVAGVSQLQAKLKRFGQDCGVYDAKHGLYNYTDEFDRDPNLVYVYVGYQTNVDGTHNARGDKLLKECEQLSGEQQQEMIREFIIAYRVGYRSVPPQERKNPPQQNPPY